MNLYFKRAVCCELKPVRSKLKPGLRGMGGFRTAPMNRIEKIAGRFIPD